MSTIIKADASGAVTLPAELCKAAGVEPGADLVAEVQAGRIILGPAGPALAQRIAARARAAAGNPGSAPRGRSVAARPLHLRHAEAAGVTGHGCRLLREHLLLDRTGQSE